MSREAPIRVATVIAAPHWGGLQTVVVRTEAALRANGVARTVVIPPNPAIRARFEAAGCDVVEAPLRRLRRPPNWTANWRYALNFRSGIVRLCQIYKTIGADVVEVAGLHHLQPAFAAKRAGLPLVWAAHSTAIPQPLRTMTGFFVSAYADALLCSGATLARRHGGLSKAKTVSFRAPIDVSEFKPMAADRAYARASMNVGDQDCVVGALGSFGWQKNHGLLVQVAKSLSGKNLNLKFRICGNAVDADASYFERSVLDPINSYGLARNGYVEVIPQTLPPSSLLNGFDIFALPSRAEGLSLVTGEAAATGLPLLGADVGGVPDLIEPGVNGYLLNCDDVAAWAARIEELAADPERRKKLGAASRERALKTLGINCSAQDHERAYRLPICSNMKN